MAEDLLDHADVDALLKKEGGGGVPGVVDAGGSDAGFGQEVAPFGPVVPRVDRRAGRGAEDQVPVLPCRSGREPFGRLLAAVGTELPDERGWERENEFGLAFAWLDAFAAGEVPASACSLGALSAVAGAPWRAWPLYLWAAVAAGAAVIWAVGLVLVLRATAWAGTPVAVGGALGRIIAAVTVAGPSELPAHFYGAFVKVHVLPAKADCLGLADANREGY